MLDTNVRRVLARAINGQDGPQRHLTVAERRLADALVPGGREAPRWAAATMELGATVCTARVPACHRCVINADCAWRAAGFPAAGAPQRPPAPRYAGSDRQARGRLLATLRGSDGCVLEAALAAAWPAAEQRSRALTGLLADGLIELTRDSATDGLAYRLPTRCR